MLLVGRTLFSMRVLLDLQMLRLPLGNPDTEEGVSLGRGRLLAEIMVSFKSALPMMKSQLTVLFSSIHPCYPASRAQEVRMHSRSALHSIPYPVRHRAFE